MLQPFNPSPFALRPSPSLTPFHHLGAIKGGKLEPDSGNGTKKIPPPQSTDPKSAAAAYNAHAAEARRYEVRRGRELPTETDLHLESSDSQDPGAE